MFAPNRIPQEFAAWNTRWSSPFGRDAAVAKWLRLSPLGIKARGPFGFQTNNTTRRFEYPWVFHEVARLGSRLRIVEIGGGLSGLQFVFGRSGHHVINIDPGQPELGWPARKTEHERLSRIFRAPVTLVPETIHEAGIEPGSVDAVVCVSTLEHLSEQAIWEIGDGIRRILRPAGLAVMTVDLFLNLTPFTARSSNQFGKNIDIRAFLEAHRLELISGNPEELLGFPEFKASRLMERLENYLIGTYPCMAQCFTARLQR